MLLETVSSQQSAGWLPTSHGKRMNTNGSIPEIFYYLAFRQFVSKTTVFPQKSLDLSFSRSADPCLIGLI
jgi:hypothetical protein